MIKKGIIKVPKVITKVIIGEGKVIIDHLK